MTDLALELSEASPPTAERPVSQEVLNRLNRHCLVIPNPEDPNKIKSIYLGRDGYKLESAEWVPGTVRGRQKSGLKFEFRHKNRGSGSWVISPEVKEERRIFYDSKRQTIWVQDLQRPNIVGGIMVAPQMPENQRRVVEALTGWVLGDKDFSLRRGDPRAMVGGAFRKQRLSRSIETGLSSPLAPAPDVRREGQKEKVSSLSLIAAGDTDPGLVRSTNQDNFFIPKEIPAEVLQKRGYLYIAADGMGGHEAGDVASQMAVAIVKQRYYDDRAYPTLSVPNRLTLAIEEANRAIWAKGQESELPNKMGTTITAAVVLGDTAYIANVGDSRTYLWRSGKLEQITKDHSWAQEQIEAGLLTLEQTQNHPFRNIIRRALGSKSDVKVDLFPVQLKPNDQLLLCSDGLTGMIADQHIQTIIRRAESPQEAVEKLIAAANQAGGHDNIAVIVVKAESA